LSAPVNIKDVSYNRRDVILYNVGIGATELCFTYENDPGFSMIPTYTTCFTFKGNSHDVVPFGLSDMDRFPGLNFNPAMLLHGEQETEVLKHPLPLDGNFKLKSKIIGVYDKGSGCVVVTETLLCCPKTDEPLVRNVMTTFFRGIGGFGGDRGPSITENPPNRPHDSEVIDRTSEYQTHIYRLSGDYNPLHIDPNFASMVGFEKPILHGLCSYGYAARAVIKQYCQNNTKLFKLMKARFSNPVIPGQTLSTKMWQEGNRIYFNTQAQGSNRPCLTSSYIELFSTTSSPNPPTPTVSAPTLKSQPIFDTISQKLKENPNLGNNINAVYQFDLKTENGKVQTMTVDLKKKEVKQGPPEGRPDCTFTVSDADYFDMATGKTNAQQLFMQGKLKISGNMSVAQKLSSIMSQNSKM
jgi:3-hydroxyacyl-CoA dehydrogenase/3a,7a,12a-trihydroxy-5b-cholest-24-enoyl-CoA hydratase